MKPYAIPVHLVLKHVRKKRHNQGNILGWEVFVPRDGERDVHTRLYRPAGGTAPILPVLFNVHGGAWIFGDSESVDLQSQYLANHLGCLVVNIDYLRADEKPFPYQQLQVADTVEYFLTHAAQYRLDPEKAVLMGYSAGGHISAGAAILLRERGITLKKQILGYPFLNFLGFDFGTYLGKSGFAAKAINAYGWSIPFAEMAKDTLLLSPAAADPSDLKGLAPAIILTCGNKDPLLPQGEQYAEKLKAAGVPTVYREYKPAIHGFLENNFPDTPAAAAEGDEQRQLMIEAVEFIRQQHIFEG